MEDGKRAANLYGNDFLLKMGGGKLFRIGKRVECETRESLIKASLVQV